MAVLLSIPLGLLEAFVSHTIFTDRQINHRSLFGLKTVREYTSVEKLLLGTNYLIIHFIDGKKVKIRQSKGNLGVILTIIRKQVGRNVPIEFT
jgi:hypothetical protein